MKKLSFLVLFLFFLVGCDFNNNSSISSTTNISNAVSKSDTETTNITYVVYVSDTDAVVEVNGGQSDWSIYIDVEGTDVSSIIDSIVVDASNVDLSTLGDYTVTYSYMDLNDETQTGSFTVSVVDTESPTINYEGSLNITIYENESLPVFDYSVTDNYDHSFSSDEVEVISNVDVSTPGIYEETYTAIDSSGNISATVTRTVTVLDDLPPVITLNGDSEMNVEVGSDYVEQNAVVTDDREDNLQITVTGSVDTSILGDYSVTYSTKDLSGNETIVLRNIHVIDTTAPIIHMNGETVINTVLGDYYQDESATVTDNYDEETQINTISNYNPFILGDYTIEYHATDQSGNTTSLQRTVHVLERSVPESEIGVKVLNNTESVKKVLELENGDFIVLGSGMSNGVINRIDKYGNIIWTTLITQETYADIYIETGILNSSNQIVVIGRKTIADGMTAFIGVYDLNGDLVFFHETTNDDHINYYGIKELTDGNYLLFFIRSSKTVISKVNTSFEPIWEIEKDFESSYRYAFEHDNLISIYSSRPYSLYITTVSEDGIEQNFSSVPVFRYLRNVLVLDNEILTVNADQICSITESGTDQYQYTIRNYVLDPQDIVQISNGHFIISGIIDTESGQDAVLLEIDSDFNEVTHVILNGSNNDRFYYLQNISNERIIGLGYTSSNDQDFKDVSNPMAVGFLYITPGDLSSVTEEDTTPPVIILNGLNALNIALDETFIDPGATALDKDIEIGYTTIGSVNTSQVGVYEIYYQAIDTAGNMTLVRRTVNVYDNLSDHTNYVVDLDSLISENNDLYELFSGFDINSDHYITLDEALQITTIYAYKQNIENLKYIDEFINLDSLTLINTGLSDINGLSNLTKLTDLDLGQNNLVDISDVSTLLNLTNLKLYQNQITDVSAIDNLDNLESLNIQFNPITDLDALGSLPILKELFASGLDATTFTTVSSYPELITLNLGNGELTSISGFNNPKLETINIYGAKLTTLDGFEGLVNSPNLTTIFLGQNDLVDVSGIANLTQLIELRIETNNITDISDLSNLVNLEVLVLVNNNISDISVLANMTKLKSLLLGWAGDDYTSLSDLTELEELNIYLINKNVNVLSNNREILETLIDEGVTITGGNFLNLGDVDQGINQALQLYDTDGNNQINLYESRNIINLDLSSYEVHSLVELDELYSLETLTVDTQYLDLSADSVDSQVIQNLEANGVTITLIN